MNINTIGTQTLELAKQVGAYIREQGKKFNPEVVERKSANDFVSFVDKTSEQMLVEGLSSIVPESGFIVEEKTRENENREWTWIVDPLDGTTNFIHQLSPFAISIALQHNNKLVLGIIYEISNNEAFYSWEGTAVYCNGTEVHMSGASKLSDSLVSTGFPVSDYSRLSGHLKTVEHVVRNSHGLRRHGSAASDMAFLASGRTDGFFEYGLSPWDVAAGSYLVMKNGGKVSDYRGGDNFLFGREMLAGNPGVHTELLEILKNCMK